MSSCRLCLKIKKNGSVDLFSNLELFQFIKIHFDFHQEILEESTHTALICKKCLGCFTTFFEFLESVKKVYGKLNNHNHVAIKEEPDLNEIIHHEPIVSLFEFQDTALKTEAEDIKADESDENLFEDETVDEKLRPQKKGSKLYDKVTLKIGSSKKSKVLAKARKEIINEDNERIHKHCRMVCDLCPEGKQFKFKSYYEAAPHYLEVHKVQQSFMCCNLTFRRRKKLVEHVTLFENPDIFSCKICKERFLSKRHLEQHNINVHVTEEEKVHQCQHCPKRFFRKFELAVHMVKHRQRNFQCDYCGSKFKSKNHLRQHFQSMHDTNKILWMCETCGKELRSKNSLKLHRESEHENREKIECPVCGQKLKNRFSFRKHYWKHKDEGLKFFCETCGKESPSRQAAQAHVRFVHAAKYDRKCPLCPKLFKRNRELTKHMECHMKNR